MPFAPVEGGQIHYEVDGEASSPALVLSNSLGTDLTMWDGQIPAFTQRFQVLRYDSFGHGQSTFSFRANSIEMLGKDVLRLMDHVGLEDAYFCGLSVGGMVGQWLALNAEKRFAKVVLCNTAARIGTQESWNARIDAVRKGGVSAVSKGILERWFTAPFHQREPATVDRFRKILEATNPESYSATCAAIRDADFRSEAPGIRAKTLVVAGTQDKATPAVDGLYLAGRVPESKYIEFDTAHLSNVEAARQFSAEVLNFLKD
jgi:3-oxoadipate enol-lactonase